MEIKKNKKCTTEKERKWWKDKPNTNENQYQKKKLKQERKTKTEQNFKC